VTPASITTFTASKMSVATGEKVTITWKVANAANVTITAAPGGVITNASTMLEGTVMSGEITAQTVFTILAKGKDGGGDAMKSVTVTIDAPTETQINSFTGSPMTVAPNGAVTLSWQTTNATSVKIDVMNGANVVMNGMPMGTFTVNPAVSTTYVLTATGPNGMKTAMAAVTVEGTPVITSFMAAPPTIDAGEMSTLSWAVTGAAMITIVDGAGTMVFSGATATGTQVVTPAMTTQYTLTARSALGQEVTMMTSVTVNQAAAITSFNATPTTVVFGGTSVLAWAVDRAPGGISISDGSRVVHTNTNATGMFTVTATRTTTYTLTAINPAGDATAMATVTLSADAPTLDSFTATPNPARVGGTSVLSWSFTGAQSTRLFDASNTEISSAAGGRGTFTVTVTSTTPTSYRVEASNPNGPTSASVILVGQNTPAITRLDAAPITFTQTSTSVSVRFDTVGATTNTLTLNGAPAPGFVNTATGTYTFTATTTVRIELTSSNAVGSVSREVSVLQLITGVDTGTTAASAIALGNSPGAAGEIVTMTPVDRDWYSFVVPADGNVRIETSDGQGGCNFDTFIDLVGPNGTTVLGSDDDDGNGACSLVDPRRDAFAANLPAGTYYAMVRGFGASSVGLYVVTVEVRAPACGNGIFERGATEQCDDANIVAADGCNATCNIESLATIGFPDNQSVPGAITTIGGASYVTVTMPTAGYISAEVFIPSRGRCDGASADPVLTLYDSTFAVLGSDNDDGIASCPRIDPTFDSFALVAAGTYYVRVSENGNNATLPIYVLDIQTRAVGCGNAIIEGAEECDDGNARLGDGCNALCEFEGNREAEMNDTFATGNVLIVTSTIVVRGTIGTPAADTTDFYLFDVPAGYHVDAYATVNGLDQCPESPEVDISLFGTTGTIIGSANFTGGPQGNCGRVWPYTVTGSRGLAAGRYGIRVRATPSAVPVYFLHLSVIAPGCGNTILEGTEQCEDGNTTSGDGCSATCGFEAVATVNLSAATTTTITGAITPEFNRDAIRVTVTGTTSFIRAETFVDAATRVCPAITTRLRLFDDTGAEIGTDATDGVNSCSLISPQTDTFAALVPGNYWLVVEEDGNNANIGRYDVVVTGIPANRCGNGIIEVARGEQCDGQTFCSAQCQIAPIATLTGPTASQTYSDAIAVAGDLDFIRVDVTAEAYIVVETGAPTLGICATADTLVRIFNAATGTELFSDDDDGPGNCSLLPGASGPAPLVQPGTYFVRVEEFGNNATIPAYQVRVSVLPNNTCGNGFREGQEQCDDNNTASGDGCSATCLTEPDGVVNQPGVQTFPGAIETVADRDIFQIVLTAASVVSVETGAPTFGTCPTAATSIRLLGPTGTLIESDTTDGTGSCSLIGERVLPAGTYTVTIGEDGDNATIAAYEIRIAVTLLSAAVEANGAFTLGAPRTFAGAITTGEIDVYQMTVANGGLRVNAETGVPAIGTCTLGNDTRLFVYDAAGVQVANNDDAGIEACSLIGPADVFIPAAGTYYVVVEEYQANGAIPAYEVRFEGQGAVCGNDIREGAEQCDDGGVAPGDGCSATCTAEAPGNYVTEVEPNDLPTTAQVLGPFNAATVVDVSGSMVINDRDFYRFTTTAPLRVTLVTYTRLGSVFSNCISGVDADAIDTKLFLYNAVPTTDLDGEVVGDEPALFQFNDDADPTTDVFCSQIAGTPAAPTRVLLPAGTYYIQVKEFFGDAIGNYFLRLDFAP